MKKITRIKNIDEHEQFYGAIREEGAKVITYAMTDTNYPRFAKVFLSVDNILANFDSDPDKWGRRLDNGVMTLPLGQLSGMSQKADGIIVMSIATLEIGRYLDGLGLSYYLGQILGLKLWDRDGSRKFAETEKNKIDNNQEKLNKVRSLLADARSRFVYDTTLAARSAYDLNERQSLILEIVTDDQYFPAWIPSFLPSKSETFIDGGAYSGDTAREFIKISGCEYEHIYSFEPEPSNFAGLEKFAAGYQNFTCYKKGLYSAETVLRFVSNSVDLAGSRIINPGDTFATKRDDGSMEVEVCSIDNSIHAPVTFIKMDIEGSELEALKGASRTISKYKPKLAICIYHKIEDFWEIPLYINTLVPEYKFYIGHHDPILGCNETVLYAIIREV
jgi:FkbM family methyltransferase